MDIITLVRIFKKLIRQHKVYLYENKIFFSHKDITINKSEISVISKSIYPVLGNKVGGFFGVIGFIIATMLLVILHAFVITIKLFMFLFYKNFKLLLFCNITIYNDKNDTINIYLINKKDYDELNAYLLQNFNLQIENLDKNYKFYK